jgi:hypothetical protein
MSLSLEEVRPAPRQRLPLREKALAYCSWNEADFRGNVFAESLFPRNHCRCWKVFCTDRAL